MNQFRGDISPAFASGNRGMQPLTDEQERIQRLLEAIIVKSPGGIAKSIGEGIQTGVDVVGSIGQLDKAEQLGRQFRRTLPDIVSAVTEQPGAVASALGQGLEQDVLEKGLGAFVGVEDAVPVVGKAGKLMTGIGAAAMMSKMPKMSKAAQDVVDASTKAKAGDLLSDPGEATAYAKIPENEPGARISQRFPMGATATEDPLTENLIIDTDVMRSDPKLTGKLVQTISEYPNIPEQVVKRGDADEIIEAMKDNEISNLRFIFDQMPPEVRDRAMQWYDGANKVANEFGQRYGVSTEQSAGIMAALSPQMDWFKNVTLAERVMDTMKNHQSAANTKEMMEWLDSNFYKPPAKPRSKDWRPAIDSIRGKRLEEIVEPVEKALWLRAFDETTRDRGYRILTPEGDFGDVVKKADGKNAGAGWGSFADIAKAVKVFDDGSMENISRTMGMQHKVRNFYNNIADPDAIYGDVTMDTHAVAAGLLRPLSGESLEVKHNLGQKVSRSKPKGVQGTYPMHAEAYRELAAQEGMLPRQMQSVTWEGVRGMYKPEQKRDKQFQASVNEVFQNFRKGNMTLEDLQKEVLRISGGVDLPDWANQ